MKLKKHPFLLFSMTIFVICMVAILVHHEVDISLTENDKLFVPKYLSGIDPLPENPTYEEELHFIISVQTSVFKIAPGITTPLQFSRSREPADLYQEKTGLCYDKSRTIEKILRYSGFEVRHFAMYAKDKSGSTIKTLISPGISSHSVTEVLTTRGWLVVDSYLPNHIESWVSIDAKGNPLSIRKIQKGSSDIKWGSKPPADIYINPFVLVYGLYSRHGMFYPPYNVIPDINYSEFVDNMI